MNVEAHKLVSAARQAERLRFRLERAGDDETAAYWNGISVALWWVVDDLDDKSSPLRLFVDEPGGDTA